MALPCFFYASFLLEQFLVSVFGFIDQNRTFIRITISNTAVSYTHLDQIRKRYGNDSVIRAAFLGGCIDHMSGGISREKRSVDYEKLKTE